MPASISSRVSVAKSSTQHKASLAKRLLFPTLSSSELPALFATPSTPPELTEEVYDFFALALRAFVNPWWTKITRYDKEFLPDITRILTHVVRAVEARVLEHDLSPLVFRDIPAIVTQHYRDYRTAESKLTTSYAAGGSATLPVLFHGLQSHMAVTAEGQIDPEYMRQVVDHVLKACLPIEDYSPEPERLVIREIVVKILVRDVIPKLSQPWFIQKMILDQLGHSDPALSTSPSPLPPTMSVTTSVSSSSTSSPYAIPSYDSPESCDYAIPSLTLVSEIFTTNARLASSTLANSFDAVVTASRLLPYLLAQTLTPKLVLSIVRNAKRTLFPNGYPAPAPPDPTPEEQAQMRARLLAYRAKSAWLESHVLPLLLGSDPSTTIATAIDPLSSQECNAHLIVLLLDCILGTLFPELLHGT
ncbi:unnamed protein product [Mycena citricolor]|uniref:PXA domain-containing protein n=1 Tax=Mycena citricolor TaxID=2018698 RepID=A0AAD2HRQ2_9AGAR|nr:unnamed protein product [Mycena citricolor]